jgi:hypothetical protein
LNVFSEVEKLQNDKSTGGLLKTQWPVSKINEVINQNPEQAPLLLPKGDYDKAMLIFGNEDKPGLLHLFCGRSEDGGVDIGKRTIPDIRAAFAAFSVMGNLQRPDIANAQVKGQQDVLDAINRVTNQPPTLPNNLSGQESLEGMTTEEAAQLMLMDVREAKKDPKTYAKWQKAQEFIDKLPTT